MHFVGVAVEYSHKKGDEEASVRLEASLQPNDYCSEIVTSLMHHAKGYVNETLEKDDERQEA